MKKENNNEELNQIIGMWLFVCPLFAWWSTWILPHYTSKQPGFFALWGIFLLINFIMPIKLAWTQTLALLIMSIGIWFGFVN